tara:strand:+ start:20272 stop:20499 length:228 start_codon:yes stop_codon:yes gene_type:complete
MSLLSKIKILKPLRYWNTRRGVGFEATTNYGNIWNDGDGGGTYFEVNEANLGLRKELNQIPEWDLDTLIDKFEGV